MNNARMINFYFKIFLTFVSFFIAPLCFAASEVITFDKSSWVVLSYNKTPSNQVSFSDNLTIQVQASAGPAVYKLASPKKVIGFTIKGNVLGSKSIETGSFDEDSILRVGLVGVGKQTLSGVKKLVAADWVKKLFALAPKGSGLDKIHFYNISNRKELFGKSRVHPQSELLLEKISKILDNEGAFDFQVELEKPLETAAIWLSVDGDNSKSQFTTTISNIELKLIDEVN